MCPFVSSLGLGARSIVPSVLNTAAPLAPLRFSSILQSHSTWQSNGDLLQHNLSAICLTIRHCSCISLQGIDEEGTHSSHVCALFSTEMPRNVSLQVNDSPRRTGGRISPVHACMHVMRVRQAVDTVVIYPYTMH